MQHTPFVYMPTDLLAIDVLSSLEGNQGVILDTFLPKVEAVERIIIASELIVNQSQSSNWLGAFFVNSVNLQIPQGDKRMRSRWKRILIDVLSQRNFPPDVALACYENGAFESLRREILSYAPLPDAFTLPIIYSREKREFELVELLVFNPNLSVRAVEACSRHHNLSIREYAMRHASFPLNDIRASIETMSLSACGNALRNPALRVEEWRAIAKRVQEYEINADLLFASPCADMSVIADYIQSTAYQSKKHPVVKQQELRAIAKHDRLNVELGMLLMKEHSEVLNDDMIQNDATPASVLAELWQNEVLTPQQRAMLLCHPSLIEIEALVGIQTSMKQSLRDEHWGKPWLWASGLVEDWELWTLLNRESDASQQVVLFQSALREQLKREIHEGSI